MRRFHLSWADADAPEQQIARPEPTVATSPRHFAWPHVDSLGLTSTKRRACGIFCPDFRETPHAPTFPGGSLRLREEIVPDIPPIVIADEFDARHEMTEGICDLRPRRGAEESNCFANRTC